MTAIFVYGAVAWVGSVSVGGGEPDLATLTCTGDCDGNGDVAIDELLTAVRLSLDEVGMETCRRADADGDGAVVISELVAAVGYTLGACPVLPTPTASPLPSPTETPPFPTETPDARTSPTETPTAKSTSVTPTHTDDWRFTDATGEAGLSYPDFMILTGDVAAGDFDNDGWTDLYLVRGDAGPNPLFRNRGNGTFEDVAEAAGLDVLGIIGSGPTFADFDGDGWLDLFVGGIAETSPRLFRNQADGTFEDITASSGIFVDYDTNSAALGDYDRDGYLDLFMTHDEAGVPPSGIPANLWRNNRDGTYSDVTLQAGVVGVIGDHFGRGLTSWMFAPNFADINNDGWLDLLVAADFGTSRVFVNNQDGTFADRTNSVISDENGMGAAVGDYDHDGKLDWFVSSIWHPNGIPHEQWGVTGNRLYRGLGDGTFDDVTEEAGVREGYWGWGSCFADFNNDGHLDIFHTNGAWDVEIFPTDPSRLFISNGDRTFTERSLELGIDDRGLGQGIVCFDYDGDGDIDIFVSNIGYVFGYDQPPHLYRNEGGNRNHYLDVKLRGRAPNTEAIGARIYATVNGTTQMIELRAGSNYVSQDPVVAHFGLGEADTVDSLQVRWPDRSSQTRQNVLANQRLVITQAPE